MTRQWLEQARKAGQTIGISATDGTFAAGVNHVADLLPSFMTDILNTAPEEQKVCSLEILLSPIVTLDYMAVIMRVGTLCIHCASSKKKPFRVCRIILYSKLTYFMHPRSR